MDNKNKQNTLIFRVVVIIITSLVELKLLVDYSAGMYREIIFVTIIFILSQSLLKITFRYTEMASKIKMFLLIIYTMVVVNVMSFLLVDNMLFSSEMRFASVGLLTFVGLFVVAVLRTNDDFRSNSKSILMLTLSQHYLMNAVMALIIYSVDVTNKWDVIKLGLLMLMEVKVLFKMSNSKDPHGEEKNDNEELLEVLKEIEPFYSTSNIDAIDKSINEIAEGKVVIKTIKELEELESIENKND